MACNVDDSWNFYRGLNGLIDNLPQYEVVSFEIKGGVGVRPEITIKEFLINKEGKVFTDHTGEAIAESIQRFKIVPIDAE